MPKPTHRPSHRIIPYETKAHDAREGNGCRGHDRAVAFLLGRTRAGREKKSEACAALPVVSLWEVSPSVTGGDDGCGPVVSCGISDLFRWSTDQQRARLRSGPREMSLFGVVAILGSPSSSDVQYHPSFNLSWIKRKRKGVERQPSRNGNEENERGGYERW
jgi:hypothetical protein